MLWRTVKVLLPIFLVCNISCKAQPHLPPPLSADNFPANVGDFAFDPTIDDTNFVLGNPNIVFQYYNTRSYYLNNKRKIETYFKNNYHAPASASDQNGYLTIRFIININGKTGRFRLYELNADYQPHPFSKAISEQLLQLTKSIDGWEPAKYKEKLYDSYQYITFKLNKGAIVCITP